jgi:protein-S-isoprenylcysteine O-methyltransferase Ste14
VALKEEFAKSGALLFRWRSYLPLAMLPLFLFGLSRFTEKTVDDSLGQRWSAFCVLVSFSGLFFRALVVGQTPARTSGRNTLEQVADVLNTTGMYSVVRHPLYVGNFLSWLGVAMFTQDPLVVLVSVLAFALYYERIMFAEERFLRERFRTAFDAWADRTPAFVPNPRRWQASSIPFSWKLVLEREYSGMFAIVATFTAFEAIRTWFQKGYVDLGPAWIVFFAVGAVAYVVLRSGKKQARRSRPAF